MLLAVSWVCVLLLAYGLLSSMTLLDLPPPVDEVVERYNELFYHKNFDCRLPARAMELEAGGSSNLADVHVVYAGDRGIFEPLLHSMISLSRHLAEPGRCSIHLILPESCLHEARDLIRCYRHELAALPAVPAVLVHRWEPLTWHLDESTAVYKPHEPDWQRHFNNFSFAWFYLPKYLPGVRRVLFLHSDTIVVSDVTPLFRMRMTHSLAAVAETGLNRYLGCCGHLLDVQENDRCFNPGVMLIDLDKWRGMPGLSTSLERWVHELGMIDADQLILNVHFHRQIQELDGRWNVHDMSCGLSEGLFGGDDRVFFHQGCAPEPCLREGRIFHFAGPLKPWKESEPPNAHLDLYLEYSPRSPCPTSK